MLNTVSYIENATIAATDGAIGEVVAVYFDDKSWTIRYLVVNTGSWLSERKVLISPNAVSRAESPGKVLRVALSQQQVKDSPNIDTQKPVSRQHEDELLRYYAYPAYWEGETQFSDVHLRSSPDVIGYDIQASDDSIGHVKDFVFDEDSWTIRYLVVDTRNWWPGGTKVLIGTRWISNIDWASKTVRVALTRDQVKSSPSYDALATITRDYENKLHESYAQPGYWL